MQSYSAVVVSGKRWGCVVGWAGERPVFSSLLSVLIRFHLVKFCHLIFYSSFPVSYRKKLTPRGQVGHNKHSARSSLASSVRILGE